VWLICMLFVGSGGGGVENVMLRLNSAYFIFSG
jgi:hypothetical protein